MRLKTGDMVKILAGGDRGKTGKIIQVFAKAGRVVVEGINKRTRHLRPQKKGERGEKIEFSAPLDSSNVMLICGKCGKMTRMHFKTVTEPTGKGKKLRVCKKCGETL